MAKKKNYYAIHYIQSKESVIVKTWAECQKKTKGRANMFKGFATEAEAQEWLKGLGKENGAGHQKGKSKSKTPQKKPAGKLPITIKLDRDAAADLRKRAESIKMPVETLVENLVLEYLYDIDPE